MMDTHVIARDRIVVRALEKGDLHRYRAIRLSALQRAPMAFGSSFEEENAYSDSVFARRLGTAGMFRHDRRSERHRGTLWGVYVAPEARGLQLGRALVGKVIDHAATQVVVLDAKVVATNEAAKRVYYALGFKTYGVEPKSLYVQGQYLDQELIYIDFTDPERNPK